MSTFDSKGIMKNAEKAVDQTKINAMQNEIKTAIAKKIIVSTRSITINDIINQLEKQGIVNSGDSNSETGQVKTQPDGYIFEITEKTNGDWEVTYIGNGEITLPEIVISLKPNTTGLTNEVIITMTAKAESGITSYTLPMGTEQSVASGTKEITKTYTATENGTYVFTVKNGNGNTETKSITIDNILQNTIQMSASTTEYTYNNVVVTITWPERSSHAVKQIKIGEGAWQTVTGSTTQITVNQNIVIKAKVQNSITDIMSNSLTVDNILQSGIIPISTKEQLLKIGTGEVVEIEGKLYAFETTSTYDLKNNIDFTGDYRETANRIQENNIQIKGNSHQIVVTTAEGKQEYYTEDSKYYIAVNKYGYVLDGLVAYYDGIDNAGTGVHDRTATVWKDLSGNGNDGVLNSFGDSIISGWGNNYLAFDGINDWVNCGEINNDYATLEIGYELNLRDDLNRVIIENFETGGIGFESFGDKILYQTYNEEYQAQVIEADMKKQEFTTSSISYDGNSQNAYLNGNFMSRLVHEGTIGKPLNNTVMAIGINPSGNETDDGIQCGYNSLKVYITRVYNRGLTEEEVEINNKSDEKRFNQQIEIPIYTENQLLKMGSNEEINIEQENKTYKFISNAKYILKSDITLTNDFSIMANKIKNGEIELRGQNYKIVDSNLDYFTEASEYCIATNSEGYIKDGLILHYDAINNTGNGHNSTTAIWKDITGNGNDATISGTYVWENNALVFEEGVIGQVLQNTTFSSKTDFTLIVAGNFNKATSTSNWPRIISTAGSYIGEYGKINGLDFAISGTNTGIRRTCSNGTAENAYVMNQGNGNVGKNVVLVANWDYSNKRYVDNIGTWTETASITAFDNINLSKIGMAYHRTTTSGEFRYNSIKLYNRALSDEEMSVNNRNDRIRFNFEYWD